MYVCINKILVQEKLFKHTIRGVICDLGEQK